MTYSSALSYQPTASSEQQMEDVAGVWAVLVAMDDLPTTAERRAALNQARHSFELKLNAAGISKPELRAQLRQLAQPRLRLRAVPDD